MNRRLVVPIALAVLATPVALPAVSGGQSSGGAVALDPPAVTGVRCARACPTVRQVTPGTSVVAISGKALGPVTTVVFLGGKGSADDRSAQATVLSAAAVEAVVPKGAHSGPVSVVAGGAVASPASADRVTVGTGGSGTIDAALDATRVTAGGSRKATVRFLTRDGGAVRVDLLKLPAGTLVKSWTPEPAAAGTVQAVSWDGKAGAAGRYGFRVVRVPTETDGAVPLAAVAAPPAPLSFDFVRAAFPIVGAHTFNMSAGRFGSGRSGHTHQGQDVFAACGTPLVAARSGTVQARATQSLAGNYLVIDVDGSHQGDMYAHLKAPAGVKLGKHVNAGDPIGFVGDTGDAEGCHLHFEMWTAPGWYRGGSVYDPLPSLRSWDTPAKKR